MLLDLVAAPGRTVVFTRTKHRAKKLSRQLNSEGVPAVELHGNLSQNARTRTMEAFHSGEARTLVATDIAARGIHVDDVALVIHADPPVEHKAYLHRSGRTARAGASGTVITLMTDDQVRDVRDLTRKAGVRATTTRVTADHPLLRQLAPGERTFEGGYAAPVTAASSGSGQRSGNGGGRRSGGRSGSTAPRGGQGTASGASGLRHTSQSPASGGQGQRPSGPGAASGGQRRQGPGPSRPGSARPARSAASFSESSSRRGSR